MSIFKVRPFGNTIQIVNPYVSGSNQHTDQVIIPTQLKQTTTVEEKNKHSIRIDQDSVIEIPLGVKEIFLSLVGGGGAGGLGTIKDGLSFSGGGGGSGGGATVSPNIKKTLHYRIYGTKET